MSNWLQKIIRLAASKEEYLASLGASPDVIAYINGFYNPKTYNELLSIGRNNPSFSMRYYPTQAMQQQLINMVRKNPAVTVEELKPIAKKMLDDADPYLDIEKRIAEPYIEPMKTWVLVQLRKMRRIKVSKTDETIPNMESLYGFDYQQISGILHEIKDWWSINNVNIESYSFAQAKDASDAWHKATAAEGTVYTEGEQNIVYGPQWKNKDFNGWTIRAVKTGNDLKAEGNKMNHCVGGYCRQVETGTSDVYSLRDQYNQPHVTIEMAGGSRSIEQIQGNSNSEPKPQYKAMLKEWFSELSDVSYSHPIEITDIHYVSSSKQIAPKARQILWGADEYGLKNNLANMKTQELYMTMLTTLYKLHAEESEIGACASVLAEAVWQGDLERAATPVYVNSSDAWLRTHNKIRSLEYGLQKQSTLSQYDLEGGPGSYGYGIHDASEQDKADLKKTFNEYILLSIQMLRDEHGCRYPFELLRRQESAV